jgi:hypothetical protein
MTACSVDCLWEPGMWQPGTGSAAEFLVATDRKGGQYKKLVSFVQLRSLLVRTKRAYGSADEGGHDAIPDGV